MRNRNPRGFTLMEIIITVAIIGLIAAVVTPMTSTLLRPTSTDPAQIIQDSITATIATGRVRTLRFDLDGYVAAATIHPDGSVVADSAIHVDRMSGRALHAP